jgi:hypothetical protein
MPCLPFLPETPRWLIEKNKPAQAQSALHYLREGSYSIDENEYELVEIKEHFEANKASGETWIAIFTHRHLFSRIWRAASFSSWLKYVKQQQCNTICPSSSPSSTFVTTRP